MNLKELQEYLEEISSNNTTHNVQAALSPLLDASRANIVMPCPKYDQLQVALYYIENPLEKFTDFLGAPDNTIKSKKFHYFDFGIRLSKSNKYGSRPSG